MGGVCVSSGSGRSIGSEGQQTEAVAGNHSSYQMQLSVDEDVAIENVEVVSNNGGYGGKTSTTI